MFTGLVETKGTLTRRLRRAADARIVVESDLGKVSALELGESIAVSGVCLTVASIAPTGAFEADVSAETLAKTTLGEIALGSPVNLERALSVGDRFGGHMVTGHIDGVGRIVGMAPLGEAMRVTFEVPPELMRFIAPKGSICVSGVSLTVNSLGPRTFEVALIAHTIERTSFNDARVGMGVNLEVDLIARYLARLMETHDRGDDAWLNRLSQAGFR